MKLLISLLLVLSSLSLYARNEKIQRLPIARNAAPAVQAFPPTTEQIAKSFLVIPFAAAGWHVTSGQPLRAQAVCLDGFPMLFVPLESCNRILYSWLFDAVASNGKQSVHYSVSLTLLLDRPSGQTLKYNVEVNQGAPDSRLF